jgi:hypothetical protein
MAHGNVQPGTVLIGDDGRVVLADARADESATAQADIRALGGVLYCSLTGHWPHAEAGSYPEPDAPRDNAGMLIAPSVLGAEVPQALDELTVDLLHPTTELPSAEVLAAELARQDNAEHHRSMFAEDAVGLDAFQHAARAPDGGGSPRVGRKMAVIIVALLAIAVVGTIAAANVLGGSPPDKPKVTASGTTTPGKAPVTTGEATLLKIPPDHVRVVDAKGNRDGQGDAGNVVDGNPATVWKTNHYRGTPNFGNLKPGMGLLLDLGKETAVSGVTLTLGTPGATVELRGGNTDPAAGSQGTNETDTALLAAFQPIGSPKEDAPTRVVFGGDPAQKVRYVLVWFTKLPDDPNGGGFQIKVLEITVQGQQ